MKKKKALLKKIGIMLALIFSFLLSIIPGNNVMAASTSDGEVIKETIKILETTRSNNVITFTLGERLNLKSITYQFTYVGADGIKYGELVNDGIVSKVDDYRYSFNVSNEVLGVKIWKIKYNVTDDYQKNKMTTGNNAVGDYNTYYKKNYVEVLSDKLESINRCYDNVDFFTDICQKTYVFYFNLDTEIDSILKLSLEYSIRKHDKQWWGGKETNSVESYEVELDPTKKVIDYEDPSFQTYLSSNGGFFQKLAELSKMGDGLSEDEVFDFLYGDYSRPVLGANQKSNGYDWYVQPLINQELIDKKYPLGSGEREEVLQEVALIKMSYISHGEYFEDVPVLDEDTGWVKYKSEEKNVIEDFLKDLFEFFKEHWYLIPLIPAMVGLLVFILWLLLKLVVKLLWRFIKWLFLLPFKIGKKKSIRINNSDMTIDKKNHVKENINKHGYNRNTDSYKY